MFWFQLYPPADREICLDLMRRAEACGVETLVVWPIMPAPSRRERMRLSGGCKSRQGHVHAAGHHAGGNRRPEWALRMLANGGRASAPWNPTMIAANQTITEFIGSQLNGGLG